MSTQTNPPPSRWFKRALVAFGILAVFAVVVLAWRLWPQHRAFYTDAETIRDPVATASLRDVLWQPPKLLPLPINTALEEYEPRLSADGLTLFFVRGKAGNNADIFTASRTVQGWSEPVAVTMVNSDADELGPEPSADGVQLFFYSNREGGLGGYDLWVTRRGPEGWLPPTNLGDAVNSGYNEYSPAASPDGSSLYFSSNRPRPEDKRQPNPDAWPATIREDLFHRDYDLYVSPIVNSEIGQATALAALNTSHNEGTPAVSPVGDFVYFASDRPTGSGGFDLYRSRRLRGVHEKPENLTAPVNSPANELDPGLSLGGFGLSFSSDRQIADAGLSDRLNYNLYHTSSREVFRDVETTTAPPIDWAAFWNIFGPSLLWALLALLLALLLWFLLGSIRNRKLDLLTKCLLASLFAHLLLMMLFSIWQVAAGLPGEFRRGGAIEVALIPSTGSGEIYSQMLGSAATLQTPALQTTSTNRPDMEVALEVDVSAAFVETPRSRITMSDRAVSTDASDAAVDVSRSLRQVENRPLPDTVHRDMQLTLPRERQGAVVSETSLSVSPNQPPPATQRTPLTAELPNRESPRAVEVSTGPIADRFSDAAQPSLQLAIYARDANTPSTAAVQARFEDPVRPTLPSLATLALPTESRPVRSESDESVPQLGGLIVASRAPSNRIMPIPETTALSAPARIVDSAVAPSSMRGGSYRSMVDSGDTGTLDAVVVDRLDVSAGKSAPAPTLDRSAVALPSLEERRTSVGETVAASATPGVSASVGNHARPAVEPALPTSQFATVQVEPQHVDGNRLGQSRGDVTANVVDSAISPTARMADARHSVGDIAPVPIASRSANVALPTDHAAPAVVGVVESQGAMPLPGTFDNASRTRPAQATGVLSAPTQTSRIGTIEPVRVTDASLGLEPSRGLVPSVRDSIPTSTASIVSRELPVSPKSPAALPGLRLPTETEPPKSMYPQRAVEQRMDLVQQHGGSKETEQAVAAALKWLAEHQSQNGAWEGDGFDARCGECGGESATQIDIGLTGLSLLCFLGADHSHVKDGPYREHILRGINWLLSQQRPDGNMLGEETMYGHAMASIALAEAYGMTRDARLRDPVKRAIDFIYAARSPAGGWRYDPGQPGDTSVSGWQVMAMRSARLAGIEVPADGFEHARRWLDLVSRPSKPGLYAYQPGREFTPAMTAEGMFMQQMLGLGRDDPRTKGSVRLILRNLPDWDEAPNTYYWYYATLAMFQHGGDEWRRWNERLAPQLLEHQHKNGRKSGSWDPVGEWSATGGRVYQTALCALMLEVYYRYLPQYLQDKPIDSIGTIRGHVVDSATGKALPGVTVRVDVADGPPSAATTDGTGAYVLAVPQVPDHFAVSASYQGYLPHSVDIAEREVRGTTYMQDFRLQRERSDVVAIEAVPEVHHLGDNRFEGRINSQFQQKSEGDYYTADFELVDDPASPKFRRAELFMLVKGVQREHEIRINGTKLEDDLNEAPSDGSFGEFIARIPTTLLRQGQNTFELFAKRLGDDIDDFEFVNVQVRLLP